MVNRFHKGASPSAFGYSKEHRRQGTDAERLLWKQLRDRKFHGVKFRRQHPVADFIADFYCHERSLIVELDGEYHNATEQKQYDDGRTYELEELGLRVIRFTNREVVEEIDLVLRKLGEYISDDSQ